MNVSATSFVQQVVPAARKVVFKSVVIGHRSRPWPSFGNKFTTTFEGNIPNGLSRVATLQCAIFMSRA
jgi:hypothetical protein